MEEMRMVATWPFDIELASVRNDRGRMMIYKTASLFNRYRTFKEHNGREITRSECGLIETWWLFWVIPIYSRETLT